jgi:hypothetical protein
MQEKWKNGGEGNIASAWGVKSAYCEIWEEISIKGKYHESVNVHKEFQFIDPKKLGLPENNFFNKLFLA